MAEHTPTPWKIYDNSDPMHIAIKGHYSDIGGAHVADVLSPANAALILCAVNNHDEMVETLGEFVSMFGSQIVPGSIGDEVFQRAKSVLDAVSTPSGSDK